MPPRNCAARNDVLLGKCLGCLYCWQQNEPKCDASHGYSVVTALYSNTRLLGNETVQAMVGNGKY